MMIRHTLIVGAFVALMAPRQTAVDALAFAQAFRAGAADQYRNRMIQGTGVNFHGAISERLADGSTRTSLVITLGSAREGSAPGVIKTWDDFVAAERARTTLVVALSGANLPAQTADAGPRTYEFSGIYDGQLRTIMRVPQSSDSTTPDSGPCRGEGEQGNARASFYCAPLLVNATAKVTP
jgi:hypothetical protein